MAASKELLLLLLLVALLAEMEAMIVDGGRVVVGNRFIDDGGAMLG